MKKYLVIDIGGSSIKYGTLNEELELTDKGNLSRPLSREKEDLYSALKTIAKKEVNYDGIAISLPGEIDQKSGICRGSSVLRQRDFPLVSELEELLGCPVSACTDGTCAMYGEYAYGNLKNVENGVMLVLGTGIGGGIILNGKPYFGSHGHAGSLSFIYSDISNMYDPDTLFGNLNGIGGLKKAVRERSGIEEADGLKTFSMIRQGNKEVEDGLKLFCRRLMFQIYNLQIILDADRYVIGGGITNEPMMNDYLQEALDEYYSSVMIGINKPEVRIAKYRADANLLGAYYNFILQQR